MTVPVLLVIRPGQEPGSKEMSRDATWRVAGQLSRFSELLNEDLYADVNALVLDMEADVEHYSGLSTLAS